MNFKHLGRKLRPYLTAPTGTLSVDRFILSPDSTPAWVAGRLVDLTPERWRLTAAGENLSGHWEPAAKEGPASALTEDRLGIGDIVAFRIGRGSDHSSWTCLDWKILSPSSSSSEETLRPVGASDVEILKKFMLFRLQILNFFVQRSFIEVRTPTLVPSPGLEPFLDVFQTEFERGREKTSFFLPTSPEFHLKKALTRGLPLIFEIRDCFRNGEYGVHHQPEFAMLEWYRAYATLAEIIEDVRALVAAVAPDLGPIRTVTMKELWAEVLATENSRHGFALTPTTTETELRAFASTLGITFVQGDDWNDLFFRIMIDRVEPAMALMGPLIVTHFPPSQAALARLTEDGWADRFEFYWEGLEIANAFHELTDPAEQRRRFESDQEKKRQLGKKRIPVDDEFLAALDYGLPPSSGIALGVDRLFMAVEKINNIQRTRLFPMKPKE